MACYSTHKRANCRSMAGSHLAFVIHPSELDSSSETDPDSECDDEGFDDTERLLCTATAVNDIISSLDFNYKCNIIGGVPCEEDTSPAISEALDEAKKKWYGSYGNTTVKYTPKKVYFAPHTTMETVYEDSIWPPDTYVDARKGAWETIARDRHRFLNRIRKVEMAIRYCFKSGHRSSTYNSLQRSSCVHEH